MKKHGRDKKGGEKSGEAEKKKTMKLMWIKCKALEKWVKMESYI